MFDSVRQVVKGRMPIYLVVGRLEKGLLIFGGSVNVFGLHYPDAHAFVSPAIDIAGIFKGHALVCRVQAAHMLMT